MIENRLPSFLLMRQILTRLILFNPARDLAVTRRDTFQQPGKVKPGYGRTALGAAFKMMKNHALCTRPRTAGGHGGVCVLSGKDEPLDRPCFSPIKARPDGTMRTAFWTVAIAVD